MTEPGSASITTRTTEETEALGASLAPALRTGDVLALSGPLGAGKTRFVAGLARGLACRARVRSPSFTLVNEYDGRVRLIHADLYRLEERQADGLGLDDYAARGALAVEWGDRLPPSWRAEALELDFERVSAEDRRITGRASRGRGVALLEAWREVVASGVGRPRS